MDVPLSSFNPATSANWGNFGVRARVAEPQPIESKRAGDGDRTRDVQLGIGVRLKTKNNGAYGLHFGSMNSRKTPGSGAEAALNDAGVM
jgi:hypothetical protein